LFVQYPKVLDKPIGLTLAPDPTTGHVYVQHIEAGMSAADSRLVLLSTKQLLFHSDCCCAARLAIACRPVMLCL
jgi:hypothetical protein